MRDGNARAVFGEYVSGFSLKITLGPPVLRRLQQTLEKSLTANNRPTIE